MRKQGLQAGWRGWPSGNRRRNASPGLESGAARPLVQLPGRASHGGASAARIDARISLYRQDHVPRWVLEARLPICASGADQPIWRWEIMHPNDPMPSGTSRPMKVCNCTVNGLSGRLPIRLTSMDLEALSLPV